MKSLLLSIIALFSIKVAFSQNRTIKDGVGYQSTLSFDEPQDRAQAIESFAKKMKLGKGYTFISKPESVDLNGNSHQRNQEFYKGIPVEFGTLITHAKNDKVYFINAEVYNTDNLSLNPTLTKNDALNKILDLKKGASFLWNDEEQANLMNYKKPQGELVIFPNVKTGTVNLAYKFDIYTTDPIARDEIYVDANSGTILFSNAIIKHADRLVSSQENKNSIAKIATIISANADTRFSGNRVIETTLNTSLNKYVLQDFTRGGGIFTYNNERKVTYQNVDFKDDDNNWTAAEFNNANKDNAGLDAHWGAEKTYDFWMSTFGRSSYDGLGTPIKSYVHYRKVATTSLINAFWNGTAMSYGDGGITPQGDSVSPLTCVDVCGHEIGHAVCQATANLVYANQSGGINEGFSDIWGACIEQYAKTGAITGSIAPSVWLLAEELGSNPFRSMNNPLSRGNPDTYLGTNWTTTADEGICTPGSTNDQCGVHNNSGVLNHWFYILTVGKSGTNNAPTPDSYNVTGIGMVKSSQIAFFTERDFLTPNSTYADVRNASLQVAASLYCGSSPEVQAVTNAWYAVNVGEAYVGYANDISLKSVTKNLSVACGTNYNGILKIENTGTNVATSVSVSYSIDGGAAVTSVWNGNLAQCQSFDYNLSLPALTRGSHFVTITTTNAIDGNSTNNSKSILVLSNDAGIENSINTFENSIDTLISYDEGGTNNLWQRGLASGAILSNTVTGGSKVYGTNLAGNYTDATKSYLVSQCYDVASLLNPQIKFDMAFDLETDYDLAYVQYSTNGGTTWSVLGTASDPNWYTNSNVPNGTNCQNCVGAQWSNLGNANHPNGGVNSTKRPYSYNLSTFGFGGLTPQSNMIFRIVFQSDAGEVHEGVVIDNFVITGTKVLANQQNIFETFSVVPNPSNGFVTIELNTTDKVNLTLFDVRGRKVFENNYITNGSVFNQEINFGSLEKGIYLLNVLSDGKQATKKIIIN